MNATEKKRLEQIEARLSALEGARESSVNNSAQPSVPAALGWTKHRKRVFSVGGLALGVAILTLLYPILEEHFDLKVDQRIDAKLTPINTKLVAIDSKVSSIAASLETLKPLINDLIEQQMKKTAALSQNDFQKTLPAVSHLLAAAHQERVTVESGVVDKIQRKLVATPSDTNQFWSVSANFLNYRSFNSVPLLQLNPTKSLRDCTDSAPEPMRITDVLSSTTAKFSKAIYRNCRFTLDSALDDEHVNHYLQNGYPLIKFENCEIVYHGGEINLIVAWNKSKTVFWMEGHAPMSVEITSNTLEFENCILDFRIPTAPPLRGQQATKILIAQNTDTLKLPLLENPQAK